MTARLCSMTASSDYQNLASLLKAAGDPMRLEVLRALSTDSFGVLELCHIFDARQSGMSHHLKVMAKAGLVTTRREGNSIFYRRHSDNPQIDHHDLRSSLDRVIDEKPLGEITQKRIKEVYLNRSKAAEEFFAEHSEKFRETQELIASFNVYGPQVAELLRNTLPESTQAALEIGPGEGEFLEVLASNFSEVSALDITPAMLEKAKLHNTDFENIDYICADTSWCQNQEQRFDVIVINMVLHHTPSPQQIFADASAALRPNGVLFVSDLCRHNQDWVKNACGDLWQGFEPQELKNWASDYLLTEGQAIYFALRNGFQIQIQQFLKDK